jgi:hypothetical protein
MIQLLAIQIMASLLAQLSRIFQKIGYALSVV